MAASDDIWDIEILKPSSEGAYSDLVENAPASPLSHTLVWCDVLLDLGMGEPIYWLAHQGGELRGALPAFVRPIDAELVSHVKTGAVVSYMREAWEYGPEDVDLAACPARNIPVMGTFEKYNDLGIFDFCGPLAAKILPPVWD
jgi:hypothetical protein